MTIKRKKTGALVLGIVLAAAAIPSLVKANADSPKGSHEVRKVANEELSQMDLSNLTIVETYTETPVAEEDTMAYKLAQEGISYEVRTVTEEELLQMDLSDLTLVETYSEICEPEFQTRASYEEEAYIANYSYLIDGSVKAHLSMIYTVWHYSDGKVHLYSRVAQLSKAEDASSSYFTYGRIMNTVGSVSYTSGDTMTFVYNGHYDQDGVEFSVTNDGANSYLAE